MYYCNNVIKEKRFRLLENRKNIKYKNVKEFVSKHETGFAGHRSADVDAALDSPSSV